MLVERDGKYELVNAYDVQIASEQCGGGDGDVASTEQQDDSSKTKVAESTEQERGSETAPGSSEMLKEANLSVEDKESAVNDSTLEASTKQTKATPTAGEKKENTVLSATSTYALGVREKKMNIIGVRTKSAPGFRRKGDEGGEQKRRNDAAFAAWLASKNEEIAKRRQIERQKFKMKEESQMHKQSINEAAYQAWLQKKSNEQLQRKSGSRPATSVPKVDEAAKQASFEAWVNSKRDQHRKKVQEEREKQTQEEEKAKNCDPTTIDQAYKKSVPLLMHYNNRVNIQ